MSPLADFRRSFRSLARRPTFALVAVATLALGIGANTAMFSVLYAAVLRPLPFPEPERLLRLYSTYQGEACCTISAPTFLDLRARSRSFERLAAYAPTSFNLAGGEEPVRAAGYRVSAGFFELLGARPQVGRLIQEADDRFGAAPVVVLSDRLWRERFAADPGVAGRTVVLETVPHTVVGVAPARFRVTGEPELFVPFAWNPAELPARDSNFLFVLGRPAGGLPAATAMAELEAIYADLVREHPPGTDDGITNQGIASRRLDEWLVGPQRRRQLFVLGGAVAMVLLVACANVANLLLARAEGRRRELAVHAALGAGRARLVWQFLSESLLVAGAGAALGVAGAWAGLKLLLAAEGAAIPRAAEAGVSLPVLGFAAGIALLTGLAVGLAPALQSGPARLERTLREGGRGGTGRRGRLRPALVVVEVAAALIVAVGAGLLLKSFWNLHEVDVGTDPARILTVSLALPDARYTTPAAVLDFYDRLESEVAGLPGVEAAGLVSAAPFSGAYTNFSRLFAVGAPEREARFVEMRAATPGSFDALGLALRKGRSFGAEDHAEAAPAVLVNAELARRLFPSGDAVGGRVASSPGDDGWQVIGVVDDLREHGTAVPPPPTVYFSPRQAPRSAMSLLVRTGGDPLALVPAVRAAAGRLDPELPLFDVATLDGLLERDLAPRRFVLGLISAFAALALLLGAIGIYGVMATTVEQRRRELGVRQALGATAQAVVAQILAGGLKLAAAGIALGLAGAFLLRRTLASLLYEVPSFDPGTYAAVAIALTATAAIACLVPARRAAAIDPLTALREE